MRDNVQAEGPEDYFRKSITVPFLVYTLNEMKTRFADLHARTALGTFTFVPSKLSYSYRTTINHLSTLKKK